jgi:hypothetical protein
MMSTPTPVRSFPREDERDFDYTYLAGPEKQVVVMGTQACDDLLESIQASIGTLKGTISVLEKQANWYSAAAMKGGTGAAQAATKLTATQADIVNKNEAIEELKAFFVTVKKEWSELKDRVIGHVVWAPAISVSTPPHGYTKDVCVIKLDKKKFGDNFRRDAIDLGAR